MPVIATAIEPHRVTRIFFDCRDAPPEPLDLRRIEQSVEQSIAMSDATEDTHSQIAYRTNEPETSWRDID